MKDYWLYKDKIFRASEMKCKYDKSFLIKSGINIYLPACQSWLEHRKPLCVF